MNRKTEENRLGKRRSKIDDRKILKHPKARITKIWVPETRFGVLVVAVDLYGV